MAPVQSGKAANFSQTTTTKESQPERIKQRTLSHRISSCMSKGWPIGSNFTHKSLWKTMSATIQLLNPIKKISKPIAKRRRNAKSLLRMNSTRNSKERRKRVSRLSKARRICERRYERYSARTSGKMRDGKVLTRHQITISQSRDRAFFRHCQCRVMWRLIF